MSRTYEALKKAEEETRWESTTVRSFVDGRGAPQIRWDMVGPDRVEYQRLRVWLTNAASRGEHIQSVMVVSCRPCTGSTTTATLLAATLAEGKTHRVLLVDGNFRTPTLNLVFNVRSAGGFSELVSQGISTGLSLQPTSRPNLSLLTTGEVSIPPADVFEGKAIEHFISELKQKFDFIIFDCAPVLEFPDAYALAPKVDGVILVVGAETTSVDEAQEAKRDLERAGGRLLGAVLNRERDYTPRFLRGLVGGKN